MIQTLLGANVFDYSKPVSLIETLAEQVTTEADIILDFFSGSGTTAHAVMQLNKEDGGNRKFIMVQLPEPTDTETAAHKAGYRTIADIGKERIRRVGAKISESLHEELPFDGNVKFDLGFKVFKLARSNFKIWESNVEQINNLEEQLSLYVNHITEDSTSEDILYELLLKSGFPLTTKVEKLEMAGKEVFSIEEGAMLICLEKELTQQLIDALADATPMPLRVICLDEGFNRNDRLKANAVQTFKARAQADESEIIFKTV